MMRTFDGSAQAIRVQVGEAFALELIAQATAGYSWQAKVDRRFLVLEDQRFEPNSQALGAALHERLVFRARHAGHCRLELIYGRPWEQAPQDRRTLDVEIRGSS